MTRSEFDQKPVVCACGGLTGVESHPNDPEHPGKVVCRDCGGFLFWLKKDKNSAKRPGLKKGTIPEVWEAWGNFCVHCNLSREALQILGLELTIQHCPPYSATGHEGYYLPYCSWCNQEAASRKKQREALLRRIADPGTRAALEKLHNSIMREEGEREAKSTNGGQRLAEGAIWRKNGQ
jgi:hypothetical protein